MEDRDERELRDARMRELGFTRGKRTGTKVIVGPHAARLAKALRGETEDEQAPGRDEQSSGS